MAVAGDISPLRTSSAVPAIASRHAGNDASEDDHRDTVTDAALGDLLAEPHQEDRARNQRDHGRDQECRPGLTTSAGCALQPRCGRDRLEACQCDRTVTRVFDDLPAALLAFLTELLQARNECGSPSA